MSWLDVLTIVLGSSVISSLVTAGTTHVAKKREEHRLRQTAELERDLRTADLFVTLMGYANARGEALQVEPVAAAIAQHAAFERLLGQVADGDGAATARLKEMTKLSVIQGPIGSAAQRAAIGLIVELADRYPVLRSGATEGLREVKSFVPDLPVEQWFSRWGTT